MGVEICERWKKCLTVGGGLVIQLSKDAVCWLFRLKTIERALMMVSEPETEPKIKKVTAFFLISENKKVTALKIGIAYY